MYIYLLNLVSSIVCCWDIFFLLDCISYLLKHICLSITKKICLGLLDIKWDILFMFLYLNNAMAAHNPLTCEDFQQRFNAM